MKICLAVSVTKAWEWDPTLYAPPRYRKACKYEVFISDALFRAS